MSWLRAEWLGERAGSRSAGGTSKWTEGGREGERGEVDGIISRNRVRTHDILACLCLLLHHYYHDHQPS